jgi:RNA polymerase sigma-70 factor, ECF subfamily
MGNSLKSWIIRLREGDQSAFLPFYEKVAPGLMRFLLWKTGGDRPLSEDILQESFVRFLVNLDKVESVEELAIQSYILQIVKNCLIDKAGRQPKAVKYAVPIEEAMHISDGVQSMRQERAVEMRELAVAMESLNEKDSEIIWLRDALGLSHKEVANQVGITEQASRQAYVRAKRSLIAEFKEGLVKNMAGAGVSI